MHPKQSKIQVILAIAFLASLLVGCGSGEVVDKSSQEKKADLYYANGTANLMSKNYTEALDRLIDANQYRPNDTKILNNLGMAYYFKNDLKHALENIKKSIEVDPKNSDARVNLASIYFKEGNIDEARAQYLHVTKDLIYANQFRTYYNLGLIAVKQGQEKLAQDYFIKSVKEREDYCPANYQLALQARRQYNFASALNWFRKAQLGTCVSMPEPHIGEAKTLIELREFEKARLKLNYILEKFGTTAYAAYATNELKQLDKSESHSEGDISLQEKINLRRRLEQLSKEESKETYKSPSF